MSHRMGHDLAERRRKKEKNKRLWLQQRRGRQNHLTSDVSGKKPALPPGVKPDRPWWMPGFLRKHG